MESAALEPNYFVYKENAYSINLSIPFQFKFTDGNKNPIADIKVWNAWSWSDVTSNAISMSSTNATFSSVAIFCWNAW